MAPKIEFTKEDSIRAEEVISQYELYNLDLDQPTRNTHYIQLINDINEMAANDSLNGSRYDTLKT